MLGNDRLAECNGTVTRRQNTGFKKTQSRRHAMTAQRSQQNAVAATAAANGHHLERLPAGRDLQPVSQCRAQGRVEHGGGLIDSRRRL